MTLLAWRNDNPFTMTQDDHFTITLLAKHIDDHFTMKQWWPFYHDTMTILLWNNDDPFNMTQWWLFY